MKTTMSLVNFYVEFLLVTIILRKFQLIWNNSCQLNSSQEHLESEILDSIKIT